MSVWDQFNTSDGGDFVSFNNPGDAVSGVVKSIGTHTWDDGKTVPQIGIATATGDRTLTASQVRLIRALAVARPEVGDTLTVIYQGAESIPGTTKTAKTFTVEVDKAGAQPAAQAAMGSVDAVGGIDLSALPAEAQAALKAANVLG